VGTIPSSAVVLEHPALRLNRHAGDARSSPPHKGEGFAPRQPEPQDSSSKHNALARVERGERIKFNSQCTVIMELPFNLVLFDIQNDWT